MTIVGQHTIAELRDLVAAKDAELSQLDKGYNAFRSTWISKDKPAHDAWKPDYDSLLARYRTARAKAEIAFTVSKADPVPEDMIPVEGPYNGILRALQKTFGVLSPGDKEDVERRLGDAGAVLNFHVPQPGQNDVDLRTFISATKALQKIDPHLVGKPGWGLFQWGLIAGTIGVVGYGLYKVRTH